jgi:hypothetical protein
VKSYSQDGEDVVLLSFFESKKNYKGFYVDVGAHHPVRFSNTHLFYKKGWNGVNIDATPGSMNSFRLIRRRDFNIESGVGLTIGLDFYMFDESALNTFNKDWAINRNCDPLHRVKKVKNLSVQKLSDILDAIVPQNQHIDFLSIDAKGLDVQVLMSNNWNRYRPSYIFVEDVGFDFLHPTDSAIYNLLSNQGYMLKSILKRSLIFEKKI